MKKSLLALVVLCEFAGTCVAAASPQSSEAMNVPYTALGAAASFWTWGAVVVLLGICAARFRSSASLSRAQRFLYRPLRPDRSEQVSGRTNCEKVILQGDGFRWCSQNANHRTIRSINVEASVLHASELRTSVPAGAL